MYNPQTLENIWIFSTFKRNHETPLAIALGNNSVAINSVRSQSFLNETALTKVSCHLLQRIPESADFFRKSMPIYGSVCPFLLYFRNFDWIFLEVNAVLRKYMSIPALLP